jgi:NhaP-type Na+/H+ or K+/H+ antiporter
VEDPRLLVIALVLFAAALFSAKMERWNVSMPAAFVTIGLLIGVATRGHPSLSVDAPLVRILAEVTLALMLFHDASRIGLVALKGQSSLPGRLLGIGLPLMIVLGTLVAWPLFPALGWVGAAIVATMLAPTDAALGEQVVSDARLPQWLRQTISVESGLNDGLCVPIFLALVSAAEAHGSGGGDLLREITLLIGVGGVCGVLLGGGCGWLMRRALERDWMEASWARFAVVALALGTYVAAASLHGSGFISAYVGGLVFGTASRETGPASLDFADYLGTAADMLSFLFLGAVIVPLVWRMLSWQVVLFAVLSLLVIRMVSVVVSLIGAKVGWPTKLFIGWFGPRGLATVVFTVMLLEADVPHKELIATIAVAGVILSVYAHGFTAPVFCGAYADWGERQNLGTPVLDTAVASTSLLGRLAEEPRRQESQG